MRHRMKFACIIPLLCMNFHYCLSQETGHYQDAYVMVLDVQQFPKDLVADSTFEGMVHAINLLLERTDPGKVIYIKSTESILSVSLKGISIDTMPAPAFDDRLQLVNQVVFVKNKANAFTVKALTEHLSEGKAEKIIVVGLLAEECVTKTLLGGEKLGYDMLVVPEAVVGKTTESKAKAIKRLAQKGIKVLSLNDI